MRRFSSEMESPPESVEVVDYFAAGTTEKDQGSEVGQVADEHESLPQHLKRLFLYCSLFPSGYEFSKDELIQLWIAEGFIRERQNQKMEDTASEHFNSLEKEGFFVLSRCDFTSVLSASTDNLSNFLYKVNPIKHSILEDTISSGNYFRAVDGRLDGASEMTRHLSLICEDIDGMTFGILQNFRHLRTLHLLSCRGSSIKHVPRDICFTLTFLRTLNLSRTLISELPGSIGNVKSLRYIDASHTPISRLPESIDSLHNLQTIKLRGCIHFVQLPKGMKKLTNLRHIDLDIIRQLDSMPAHLGNLSNLRTLPAFLVGRDDGCHVGELKNLNDLKGALNIARLENVLSKEEAGEAALVDKKGIHSLELRWSNHFVEYAEQQEKVLECLQPHSDLKELQIQQYSGSILPTWISNPAFADLVVITLYRCRNCKLLPCMGQLPALKSLSIIEVNEVKEINHQFFRNGPVDHAFPKLERLEVDIMLNLKEWKDVQMGDLPSLLKFTVDSCPELVTIPPLSCLKFLKHLEFRRCPKLLSLPTDGLPTSLESFLILDCLQLKEWCLNSEHRSMLCHVPSVWFDNEEVSDEVDQVPRRCSSSLTRSPSLRSQALEPSSLHLDFSKSLSLPIFTASKISDEDNNPIQILVVDKNTIGGGHQMVPIKVEIVVLDGDFPRGDGDNWTSEEFDNNVLKARTGKRPLLTGDVNVTLGDGFATIGDIQFTDNSSWIRSRKFRLGARVVAPGTGYKGSRIREAMTDAFVVNDHRGELRHSSVSRFYDTIMVRKRRTELPSGSESSESGSQRPAAPPPQQQQQGGGGYQATPVPYQAGITPQPAYQASSSSQPPEPSEVAEQFQQVSIQQEEAPSHAIQHVPVSSKSMRFPLRPGKGKTGIRCTVKANHFFVELPDKDLHQYDVTITPEVTSRGVNRAVMEQLVTLYRESHLSKRLPAYDGWKSLYTAGPLPFQSKEFKITLLDDDEGQAGQNPREREFRVVIKFAARADLHHLGLFLQGRIADAPQEALQVLNIVLRELPSSRYCPVGRSFYDPGLGRRQPLGEGLESWCGFYQSIRPTQMGLSLNIDTSSTTFIKPLPVIEFVTQLLNRDVQAKPLSDSDRVKIKKALSGVKVEVTHRGNMRRKYRISGLTSQATRELTFPVDERGTMKYVVEYFQETYGFVIQHPYWPCLQVGNQQRPNYLPMEVCKIVAGQRYSGRLNERQITALLNVTCQRPQEREHDIIQTVLYNSHDQDPYAKEFGIKISENLAQVEARILPPPWLKYHDTGREKDCLPQDGQWNMMNKKMVNGGKVRNWICINFSRNVQDSVAKGFCYELGQMCHISGMVFNPEPVLPPVTARPDQVEKVLKTRYHDAMTKIPGQELDLLVVILPDNNGSLYGDLKRICETDLGLVSQCCLTRHVFRINKQYLANVALKINVKVGGRNTVLLDAISRRIPLVSDRPTIIFGAHVTHPHPGEDSSPSIAAVVASQDWPEITKYAGLVCAQAHRQELIQDLFKQWQDPVKGTISGGMIKELLISFCRATGQKPQRIIFYRDGVSEGQFYRVLLYELDAIRKACASLEPNYQPPVTFVVVQKRHHTRLFANNHRDLNAVDRSGNILPGTVVDSKICHPTEFDFYLCSHAGIQGTSRPAHYHVLWDENKFTANALQSLTNNLCYTYARCTRSVSIVPPAYYAHLAAFRARFYMEPETSYSGSMSSDTHGRGGGMGGAGGGRSTRAPGPNAAVRPLPALKENVKKVMFFC